MGVLCLLPQVYVRAYNVNFFTAYVPVSSWTMEKKGGTRVLIAGIDDKRQVALYWQVH